MRIVHLFFNVARCLRSPEIEVMFEILKLGVNEFKLVEARVDELRVVALIFIHPYGNFIKSYMSINCVGVYLYLIMQCAAC